MNRIYNEFRKTFEAEGVLDYEFVSDSDSILTALLRSNALNHEFHVFLEDPVGSAIAFWKLENGEEPIVYLNSEGSPFAVIAKDFPEFLTLLYFGSYAPLEIEPYLSFLRSKKRHESLGAEFTQKEPTGMASQELAEIKERLKLESSNYNEVIQWLEKHNILCSESPFEIVVKAFNTSPNVNEFIESKLN